MARDVQQEIDQTVNGNPVVLYMKGSRMMPQCGFSAAAVQMLEGIGADFKYVNVLEDPEVREGIKLYGQWPTIPQLYIGGELVGGIVLYRNRGGRSGQHE